MAAHDGPGRTNRWLPDVRSAWIGLLGAAAPIAGALVSTGRVRLFLLLLVGVFLVLVILYVLIEVAVRYGSAWWQKLGTAIGLQRLLQLIAVVTGMSVSGTLWAVGGWIARQMEGCEPPPGLRVMAAPEHIREARQAAEDFAKEVSENKRCLPVRVTVYEAPSPGRLQESFQDTGDTSERPRPDVWLPAADAHVDVPVTAGLERVPLGTSPLVLAVPPQVNQSLQLAQRQPDGWGELIGTLKERGVGLLIPDPEATDSGLAAVHALFTGNTFDTPDARRQRHDLIRTVNREGMVLTDPAEVLCRLADSGPDKKAIARAAIVPLTTVVAYNSRPGRCGGGSNSRTGPLIDVQPVEGTLKLARSAVRVSWPGPPDPKRDDLARRFIRWYPLHGVTRGSLGGADPAHTLTREDLLASHDLMTKARAPLSLEFMIDYSGTMNAPSADGTLLAGARTFVSEALERLGGTDRAALWRFPGPDDGRAPQRLVSDEPVTNGHARSIRLQLARLSQADASITPLFHAIAAAAQEPANGQGAAGARALVVLTDGVNYDRGYRNEVLIPELRNALGQGGAPQVYVVVLQESGCPKVLRELQASGERIRCLDLGNTGGRLLDGLFSELSKES